MTIYHWIGVVVFVLFCIAMIWQIESDMRDTQRIILKGYGYANALHSAQTFEKTGVTLDSGIDYFPCSNKEKKLKYRYPSHRKTDANSLDFEI